LEEGSLGRVVASLAENLVQALGLLNDLLSDLLLLFLAGVVLGKVVSQLLFSSTEDGTLVSLALGDLHEVIDGGHALEHVHTVVHHGLLLLLDLIELVEAALHGNNRGVLHSGCGLGGGWDLGR
jgi:hypothetical protein